MSTLEPKSFRDKLGMLDETGQRLKIIPAEVSGRFRKYRNWVHLFLVVLFLILPWIRINGAPAILLDLPGRHFAIFGLEFWAHDAPMIFFVLGIITISVALVTALWGRVWCGWACPQTVFLDGIFRRIEKLTEGNHLQRRALDRAPFSLNKFLRKFSKWTLFIAVTFIMTHSFLAYFVGSDRVLDMITHSPKDNWGVFIFIMILSGLFLFDLAWFREQFCVIMCPYGRFQSVLYDKNTITIQYDESRGEPRKGKVPPGQNQGDCVNCSRCIQVCPTGIDIRDGVQMECIACTACIDACDDIMEKVKKPKGLIRYMPSIKSSEHQFWRPRIFAYGFALLFMITGLTWAVSRRTDLHIQILRSTDVPYFQKVDNNQDYIVNSYRLHIQNKDSESTTLNIQFAPQTQYNTQDWKLQIPSSLLTLKPKDFKMIPFLIEIPKDRLPANGQLKIQILVNQEIKDISFVGPHK